MREEGIRDNPFELYACVRDAVRLFLNVANVSFDNIDYIDMPKNGTVGNVEIAHVKVYLRGRWPGFDIYLPMLCTGFSSDSSRSRWSVASEVVKLKLGKAYFVCWGQSDYTEAIIWYSSAPLGCDAEWTCVYDFVNERWTERMQFESDLETPVHPRLVKQPKTLAA